MVDAVVAVRILGGVVLLLSNGFFVTTEFALTRVRQFSESEFQDGGLARAWEMTERLEIYLSGCQVGITISSIGLGVVAEPAVAAAIDPIVRSLGLVAPGGSGHSAIAVIVGFAIINLLHVVIGEQAPTYLGIERTKFVARYGGPLLYYWTKLMSPVIIVADRIAKAILSALGVDITRSWTEEELEDGPPASRSELRRQMGDAMRGVGISDERRDEILGALAIGQITVADIMIDRDEIVALSTTDDLETNLQRLQDSPHVRFPLVGADLSDFRGIVYTPEILRHVDELQAGTLDFESLAAPPLTVGPDTVVSDLIDRFQAESQELALVVDDSGDVSGLVTTTDAFEQIAGDLEDPLDAAVS